MDKHDKNFNTFFKIQVLTLINFSLWMAKDVFDYPLLNFLDLTSLHGTHLYYANITQYVVISYFLYLTRCFQSTSLQEKFTSPSMQKITPSHALILEDCIRNFLKLV